MSSDINHLLNRAKIALMSNKECTFFTAIVMSLKLYWDEDCPTAWTDGYRIGWNSIFFLSLTEDERVFVLMHEASHVAYDHMGRLLGRDMRIWNKAADHVINLYLEERGFKMPSWVLKDQRFKGMSADQVYNILMEEKDDLPFPMEDIRIDETKTQKERKQHVEDIIIRAAIHARAAKCENSIPGEVEVFLQNLLSPRLPWQTILRREMHERVKNGHTWMLPNRRYFPQYHLPSRTSIGPTEAVFYVDISMSVSDEQFTIFVSEITGCMRMFNLKKVTIVQFDTEIKSVHVVKSLRELSKVKFKGRGGTDIAPILDHMEETKPQFAMVFTDGGFYWPREQFKQRILWLINDNPSWLPKFGKAIHFKT